MNHDIAACASIVQRADADRFLAIMSAPLAAREKLFPLFAFNIEVSKAPWVTQETMIAEMRLQWWRDALEQIATGQDIRRHEVVTPLAGVLPASMVPLLDQMIEARRWDIYKDPFVDEADFQRYIDQTAGNLMCVACGLMGEFPENLVRAVAYADGLARWFQAIPELEGQSRIPLVDGRPEALVRLAQHGLEKLNAPRVVDPAIVPVLRMAWQAKTILKQVVRSPDRVASGALGTSEFWKKSKLFWLTTTSTW
ncbi:squalene/phytoene synthase family protein [Cognatishimia sp. WU-CL00825]|uniref:squalene/phytoene synthase family protein n=1 Tax=Cognatishimia sp. WU-CL00825 TaxID=3127658 RepID=UPI0031075158